MRFILFPAFVCISFLAAKAQDISTMKWYSETNTNGIVIQNSFPKGGLYKGPTTSNYNYSHLVFINRVVNETDNPIELTLNFSADPIRIPQTTDTYLKIFLPSDTMSRDKIALFDYGVTHRKSFDHPTRFERTLKPKEECLFYVEVIYYQTIATPENNARGGNRAELTLKGQDLYYNLSPAVNGLLCGRIIAKR